MGIFTNLTVFRSGIVGFLPVEESTAESVTLNMSSTVCKQLYNKYWNKQF